MQRLVIAPMQEEVELLVQECERRGYAVSQSTVGKLPIIRLPELAIALARGGVGKTQFAVHTQHLLDNGAWKLVVCAGGAGALVDELTVGDVVVATKTVEHDYTNRFNERPLPAFRASPDLLARLMDIVHLSHPFKVQARSFGVHFGVVASGDEDVVDDVRRGSVRHATGAMAVAWEGAGGARACQFSGVPFVEIRGVTDLAGPSAPQDFEANLARAMANVATLLIVLAKEVNAT